MTQDAQDQSECSALELGDATADLVYVNQLNLVLAGDRVFLVDESSFTDVREEVAAYVSDTANVAISPLNLEDASVFARYMDWDAVCATFPADHPINDMPIPSLRTVELDPDDRRLRAFDLESLRAAHEATGARLRGGN